MSAETLINLKDVSRGYALYAKPSDMVRELIFGGTRHDVFWALRNINLSVREGDRVGIVGPNGAGKSTLLQIISGNLAPSSGQVSVRGRISALLSLAPAWSKEESGLENIRFNLHLQGCDPAQISALAEEIADFTELGPFIYQPVKTYSTGMSARLAFGVATAVTPDLLIIDEVLGVGDAYFASKAYQRMRDLVGRGRALLFVSHAIDAVRRMCDVVVWLQNGVIRQMGPAGEVLDQYEADFRAREDEAVRQYNRERSDARRTQISIGDLVDDDLVRLRIVPVGGTHFADTHYVRDISIRLDQQSIAVPLGLVDVAQPATAASLDILMSEWGRVYERHGHACRILTRNSGRLAGGHILVKPPPGAQGEVDISVSFVASAINNHEHLEVQARNLQTGKWQPLPTSSRLQERGWARSEVMGRVPVPSAADHDAVRRVIEEQDRPLVEIISVFLEVDGLRTRHVRERQSFRIGVHARARSEVPIADIGIKVIRNDGIYVFWDSSGLDRSNFENFKGEVIVYFCFDENPFGAGEYAITAYAANGWDVERNYPYSEVYCRLVSAFQFRILREIDHLDFGVVNVRARIETVAC